MLNFVRSWKEFLFSRDYTVPRGVEFINTWDFQK